MPKYKLKFREVVEYEAEFTSNLEPEEMDRNWFDELNRLVDDWSRKSVCAVPERDLISLEKIE